MYGYGTQFAMGSANFQAYERTLRRQFIQNLVEALAAERGNSFRASLVVNPRTGFPAMPRPGEVAFRRRTDPSLATGAGRA